MSGLESRPMLLECPHCRSSLPPCDPSAQAVVCPGCGSSIQLEGGATLAERLTAGRMSFRQAAVLVADIAEALHYAHAHGVVHRDIKPSNIMLDLEGKPHVMDFGLAKRSAEEGGMTLEGQVLG